MAYHWKRARIRDAIDRELRALRLEAERYLAERLGSAPSLRAVDEQLYKFKYRFSDEACDRLGRIVERRRARAWRVFLRSRHDGGRAVEGRAASVFTRSVRDSAP